MLLTSWMNSFRRTLKRTSVSARFRNSRRQRRRHLRNAVRTEALEDRVLLSALVIENVFPGSGINITNLDLDRNLDGDVLDDGEFDSIVIQTLTIDALAGPYIPW